MTRVADSSFLIALFDKDDPRQAEALAAVRDPEPIEVPSEVLSETLGVVHRRMGYARADAIWRGLVALSHVTFVETTDIERTSRVFKGGRGKLSWVDAVVVAACTAEDSAPLCFDQAIVSAVRG